jgi:acyl-CoA thioesterase FadM
MAFSIPTDVPVGETPASEPLRGGVLVDFLDVARAQWWRGCEAAHSAQETFEVSRLEMDLRKPVRPGDRVRVELRVDRVGTTSFSLNYKILREPEGVVMAEAHSLQVILDARNQRPRPIGTGTLQWLRSQA